MELNIKDNLLEKSAGFEFLTRKELTKSMEMLAKEGYEYMDLRVSEIRHEDVLYFREQGITARLFQDPFKYYQLSWGTMPNPRGLTDLFKWILSKFKR